MDAGVDAPLIFGVVGERKLDGSLIGQALLGADEEVALVESPLLECRLQRVEGGRRSRHDDGTARLGVQAMDDAGLACRVSDERFAVRDELRVAAENGVDERPHLARPERRGGLTGRLVENDDLIGFEHHAQGCIRGRDRGRVSDLCHVDPNAIAARDRSTLGHPSPIHPNRTEIDRTLDASPTELRDQLGDGTIEASPIERCGNDELSQRARRSILGTSCVVHRNSTATIVITPTLAAPRR